PSNPPKPLDNPCSTAPGAGFCNNGGKCVECNTVSQCSTAKDNECQHVTCDANNKCTMAFTAAGTALSTGQINGDCHKLQCNGQGAIVNAVDDMDVPSDGNDCTTDACSGGVASHTPVNVTMMMVACGLAGGHCDMNGQCLCSSNADC